MTTGDAVTGGEKSTIKLFRGFGRPLWRVDDLGFDTADERFFSHRVRGDVGRQITAARLVTA